MAASKTIYTLHYWDPSEGFEGREWEDRCVFESKEVAEFVRDGILMFQEKGSELSVTVRSKELFVEPTVDEWMKDHGPGDQRRAG